MLEKLAGRLTWEPTGEGIRVEIPSRRSRTILLRVLWLILWFGGGWLALARTLDGRTVSHIPLIWLVGWGAGALLMTASLLWILTGSTTFILNSRELRITRQMMGMQLGMRTFADADVRNLRFVPAMIRGRSNLPSHISFEEKGRTRSFASALAETEAVALFDKMDQIYKFPRNGARG
ncbi:MAG: hypothetical protein ABSG62_23485 [Terracidiphilus sp.]